MAIIGANPKWQELDSNGNPGAGARNFCNTSGAMDYFEGELVGW